MRQLSQYYIFRRATTGQFTIILFLFNRDRWVLRLDITVMTSPHSSLIAEEQLDNGNRIFILHNHVQWCVCM